MIIDQHILKELTTQVKASSLLRMNLDLRDVLIDKPQQMPNAIELGTVMPTHRYGMSSETAVCIRGYLRSGRLLAKEEILYLK